MVGNDSYIKEQVIAYIGNKRNLLPLIRNAIEKIGVMEDNDNPSFFDFFAGSGVVSRLAKSMGFEVYCNDWEYYSYIINKAFIELDNDFLKRSFLHFGGIESVLEILNNIEPPSTDEQYISYFYCPKEDENPDLENERMFYTSYNGKRIDAIRSKIASWVEEGMINEEEELLLLALLLYECSTRSNTSGVFKGFHKGFGGTNGDALSRIMKEVELKMPKMINGKKAKVFKEDAIELSERLNYKKFDIVYLDPPYNQHQYGSNYHLLNTIALNDRPEVNKEIFIDGKKTNKSAIRKDWVKTKSTFCYKSSAKDDFKKLVKNINANYILVSYSTDGIISFDEMLKILSSKGKLDICLSEYTKYRGGKQALTTEVKNIEFVLIVNTNQKGSIEDVARVKKILCLNKIKLFMKKTINPIRAEVVGFSFISGSHTNAIEKKKFGKKYFDNEIIFYASNNKISELKNDAENLMDLPYKVLESIREDFEYITGLTKEDEIYLTIQEIVKNYKVGMYKKAIELFKDIPYYISKFNNKKAYVPSLKSIVSILDMMIQTIDIWTQFNIINYSFFKKFEKIILLKLNYNQYEKKRIYSDKDLDNIQNIKNYKKQIGSLYEYLINKFERPEDVEAESDAKDLDWISYNPSLNDKIKKYNMANVLN